MEPFSLVTPRLVLSPVRAEDAALVEEYCQDPGFQRYMVTPWPYRRAHADSFVLDFVPSGWKYGRELTWVLRESEDGPLLGVIGFRLQNLPLGMKPEDWPTVIGGPTRTADLGYWLGAPHRGHGYMPEAVTAVLDWAFSSGYAGIEEIVWEAIEGNIASGRVAWRAGLRYAGIAPARIYRSGEEVDGHGPAAWHARVAPTTDRSTPDATWPASVRTPAP